MFVSRLCAWVRGSGKLGCFLMCTSGLCHIFTPPVNPEIAFHGSQGLLGQLSAQVMLCPLWAKSKLLHLLTPWEVYPAGDGEG